MKTLIIYYSLEGNTKKVAEIIHHNVESDLVEVNPIVPYLSETAMSVSKNEV